MSSSESVLSIFYFNPRSSGEERHCRAQQKHRQAHFNPRSSGEERRPLTILVNRVTEFQSTLLG